MDERRDRLRRRRLLERLGKTPVVMGRFVPGFCVNRLLRSIGREVFFLLDNGYLTPEQLDAAVKASLVPRAMVLGFVQRYDFTGLDLSLANLRNPDYVEPAPGRRAAQPRRACRARRPRRQDAARASSTTAAATSRTSSRRATTR